MPPLNQPQYSISFLGSAMVNPFREARDILCNEHEYPTFHVERQATTRHRGSTRKYSTLNT